jgi:hypothetical protein
LGLAFYKYFAPLALGRDCFGIGVLQLFRASGAGVGLVWDPVSTTMSRRWRWGLGAASGSARGAKYL